MKIWDNCNKQWLEPMCVYFDGAWEIRRVEACVPNADVLKDGWYTIEGDDLSKIAIIGEIKMNEHLLLDATLPKNIH